ncbi:iron(III) transport system permease protein [Kitasatospora sp. MAP12-15]|uniref:ABC transporter permease n=1 Tax=unclassified Kitasatospora TaxID=2633591 RepID=UPI0024753AF5|nr:iron ABC transporter permease [Kitasatospora sp. MAP12-44]MDH6108888.1 iron(III) transport system permease protein [Kitasatospora sp. MAP12-44]
MPSASTIAGPRAADRPPRAGRRLPWLLTALSVVVAALLLLPLGFLLLQAGQAGWSTVGGLMFRRLTWDLLCNTVELAVIVTAGCALLGTAAAYCVERVALPGRRIFSVLLVLPVAVPDFVVGYAWSSWVPFAHGLTGAVIVMTLSLYPLVYLPVAAALRAGDAGLEEQARSLGRTPWQAFREVTLRQIRPALLGGCLVVALALLAEYGAFEVLRFQTFTTEIFTEYLQGFDGPAACALSLVLVVLSLAVLLAEYAAGGGGRVARRVAVRAPRLARPSLPAGLAIGLGLAALSALALALPVGTLAYWCVVGGSTTLPPASVLDAAEQSGLYALAAAALTTALALPVALLSVRHRSRLSVLLERSTYLVQGLPGLAIALGLVFFGIRYVFSLYQSPALLVVGYAIMFFPLALVALRSSVASAPVGLEEIGRSLGRSRWSVALRVTLPLVAPGLAAGFCLVFLSVVTELTATLILVPTGVHTLATRFWEYESDLAYGAAAPYAALMVAIAAVPSYLLGRWFDRVRARQEQAS